MAAEFHQVMIASDSCFSSPCLQGVRSDKVGIIDAEYILHKGIPSLGGSRLNRVSSINIDACYNLLNDS
jgi:hypothetical protein